MMYFFFFILENSVDHDDMLPYAEFGPGHKKTYLRGFMKNTSTDQPAHPCSLISTFVIPILESIISKLASHEIPIF